MAEEQIVTSITPSARDAKRFVVKVGNRAVGTLPGRAMEEMGLTVGVAWTAELAGRVEEALRFDKAMRTAFAKVARRALSEAVLRERLLRGGIEAGLLERVIARLRELGLVDDRALAESIVEATRERKPAGKALLREKLIGRGVDEATAEEVAERAAAGGDPVAEAERLARQKLRTMTKLDAATRQRRLWGLLARRGFEEEVIEAVVERVGLGGCD